MCVRVARLTSLNAGHSDCEPGWAFRPYSCGLAEFFNRRDERYTAISNNVGCVNSFLEHTTPGSPRRAPLTKGLCHFGVYEALLVLWGDASKP